nr:hypothetical protein [Picobirnavirus sp.]AVD97004.1 hypothetical protein [Picobirnavirus sp.]AVD97005.1 hypothetical protein [Picobirnavirus sp.]
MTQNQIAYQQHLERQRSNLAQENETHRANVEKEKENLRSNLAKEYENRRSNIAQETLGFGELNRKTARDKWEKGTTIAKTVTSGIKDVTSGVKNIGDTINSLSPIGMLKKLF